MASRITEVNPHANGLPGRLMLGSVAQSLLHSGEVPIALAPSGYANAPFTRLVVGFEAHPEAESVVQSALELAHGSHATVELLTVVVRVTKITAPRLGHDPEHAVLQAMTEQAQEEQAQMRRRFPAIAGVKIESADSVQGAMDSFDWRAGDLFVLGSSADGLLRRVFLGDTSHQLLRATPVPALVLPRAHGQQ